MVELESHPEETLFKSGARSRQIRRAIERVTHKIAIAFWRERGLKLDAACQRAKDAKPSQAMIDAVVCESNRGGDFEALCKAAEETALTGPGKAPALFDEVGSYGASCAPDEWDFSSYWDGFRNKLHRARDRRQRVHAMHENGKSIAEIAEYLDLSHGRIRQLLVHHKRDLEREQTEGKFPGLSPETSKQAARVGMSNRREIAEAYITGAFNRQKIGFGLQRKAEIALWLGPGFERRLVSTSYESTDQQQ